MSEQEFEAQFNIQSMAAVMRELLMYRMNELANTNTANHFWQAQTDVSRLRRKLETSYKSAIQKAKKNEIVPEIWMFGAAAYDLITEQGIRLADVVDMSGAKLAELAAEQGRVFEEKANEIGEAAYMVDKKSKEK